MMEELRSKDLSPALLSLLDKVKEELVSFQVKADQEEAVCIIERQNCPPFVVKRTWEEIQRSPVYVEALLREPSLALRKRSILIRRAKRDAIEAAFRSEILAMQEKE